MRLRGGADGLSALTTYDFIGEPVSPLDSDEAACLKRRGLQALADVSEVAIVAIPDIHIRPIALPLKAPPPACIPDPCLPLPIVSEPFTEELSTELPPVFSRRHLPRPGGDDADVRRAARPDRDAGGAVRGCRRRGALGSAVIGPGGRGSTPPTRRSTTPGSVCPIRCARRSG